MRANRYFILLLAPLALAACDTDDGGNPNDGGQFGEESGAGCKPQSETPLGWDEAAPNGQTAQALTDATDGEHTAPLTWNDSTTTGLTVTVASASNPRFIDYEWESDGHGMEPAIGCVDTVAIDVDLTVATDDGQLDDQVVHTLELADMGEVTAYLELDGFGGSFAATDWTTESFDDVWADLEVAFGTSGISGAIRGYGEKTSGSGPDGTVSLSMFDIATF